jgi:fumarate hydratase subunit beta
MKYIFTTNKKAMKTIYTHKIREDIPKLSAGEEAYLSGVIYTARDAAHKKLSEMIEKNLPLPVKIKNASIYYAGPTPAPKINPAALAAGSCGPTTSKRMDIYTPALLEMGLACTIGKGPRSALVYETMRKCGAIYLCAVGGAGALYSSCIKSVKTTAFEELGCEAVMELEIEKFPVYVAFDVWGKSIFAGEKL